MSNNPAGDLEEKFHDAIQRVCETEEDANICKEYFQDTTINMMIEEALSE